MVAYHKRGRWKMRGGYYIPTAHRARKVLKQFTNIRGEWIPREKNDIADELSKAELIKAGASICASP